MNDATPSGRVNTCPTCGLDRRYAVSVNDGWSVDVRYDEHDAGFIGYLFDHNGEPFMRSPAYGTAARALKQALSFASTQDVL